MRGLLYVVAGLSLAAGLGTTVGLLVPGCRVERGPLWEEVGEITARHAEEDEAVRASNLPAAEKDRRWADVRQRRAAEVREAYIRHGRVPPVDPRR